MGNCDITDGRLFADCFERAGVKTVFFFRHSLLKPTKNPNGEIDYFGNGTLFRFEQDNDHGLAIQEIVKGDGTTYVNFQIDMTLFYLTPGYWQTINYLKNGLWAIFFLDYEDKIRLMGEASPLQKIEGVDQSGTLPDETMYINLVFHGMGDNYAPYLEPFTDYPFDNFPVQVVPEYFAQPNDILANATDYILIDNLGNKLSHG